jgi:peptidoglycan/LPS O-acetylase OafA/YrhL
MKNSLWGKSKGSGEISSIVLLRGIASLMVCLFHMSVGNPQYLPANNWLRQIGSYGWTGVEVFFVISGFVIPYSMFVKQYATRDFWAFLKKRIIRIEPPYLVSIVLVISLNYISTLSPYYRGAPYHPDWGNIAGHVAYLNVFTGGKWVNDVYWSLAIEFQYYILIALTFKLIVAENRFVRLGFFVAFALSSALLPGYLQFIFTWAAFFMLGILLFQYVCKIISQWEFLIMGVAILAFSYYRHGTILTAISLGALLIILFVNRFPSWLRFFGTISYSLYLIHIPIGGRIINLSENFIHNTNLRVVLVFVGIAVSVVCAALYYRFIEKPFKSRAAMIRYDRPTLTEPTALSPTAK